MTRRPISRSHPSVHQILPFESNVMRCGVAAVLPELVRYSFMFPVLSEPLVGGMKLPIRVTALLFSVNHISPSDGSGPVIPYGLLLLDGVGVSVICCVARSNSPIAFARISVNQRCPCPSKARSKGAAFAVGAVH